LGRHWDLDVVRSGEFDGLGVTAVRVTKNTHARVARENALEATFGIIGPFGNDNHSSVLRETDANATAVVNRHP
jgi:hypothetical protein